MFDIFARDNINGPNLELTFTVLRESLKDYVQYERLLNEVAKKIVEEIYPEIKEKILTDPTFQTRIINEVLLQLSKKLAEKLPDEETGQDRE